MKHQTLVMGSILAAGIVAIVVCVGMVTGFPLGNPLHIGAVSSSGTYIHIDPVANQTTGNLLIVRGTTNLPAGTTLMVQVSNYGGNTEVYNTSNGSNWFSMPVDTAILKPGTSTITVMQMKGDPAKGDYGPAGLNVTASFTLHGAYLATDTPVQPTVTATDFLRVNPVGNRAQGDQFLVTGTTSLPIGTQVIWMVGPAALAADATGIESGIMGGSPVTKGSGTTNRVSFAVDTTMLPPGLYNASVSIATEDFRPGNLTGYALFTLTAPGKTGQSSGEITLAPISDKHTGDDFPVTGTTSLPAGTNLIWQIIPDPGTSPTGIDMNAQSGIMANNQVINGDTASNRVSLDVNMTDMKPGKYLVMTAVVVGDPLTADPATASLAGYTYFTLE
ncbi:MAG: hypothetical protein WC362_04090 [Methanoregula sp.]|jgi:hypothetical protein